MRRLILIRHSVPEVRRDLPAADWRLSAGGVDRARAFSRQLPPSGATRVFTSHEPKAVETARTLAEAWGLAIEEVPGLQEHERPQAHLFSRNVFERKIAELFSKPDELVLGAETANQARRRFTASLMRLLTRHADDVIVVSHGTVIALFVAEVAGVEPFAFWKRQEMPFAVTLTLPELRLESTTFLSG